MLHEHSDPRSLTQPSGIHDGGHPSSGHSIDPAETNGDHAAHNKHAGHDPDVFRRQFWIVPHAIGR